jgi:hypothetical protein
MRRNAPGTRPSGSVWEKAGKGKGVSRLRANQAFSQRNASITCLQFRIFSRKSFGT